jgi:hypothetical protein
MDQLAADIAGLKATTISILRELDQDRIERRDMHVENRDRLAGIEQQVRLTNGTVSAHEAQIEGLTEDAVNQRSRTYELATKVNGLMVLKALPGNLRLLIGVAVGTGSLVAAAIMGILKLIGKF